MFPSKEISVRDLDLIKEEIENQLKFPIRMIIQTAFSVLTARLRLCFKLAPHTRPIPSLFGIKCLCSGLPALKKKSDS